MRFLRSFLFNVCFYSWTGLVAILGLPLLITRPSCLPVGRIWARGSIFLVKHLCGITHRIIGAEQLSPTPVIYASKHQSAWETLMFWILLGAPAYVLKKELLLLPLFGWYLSRMGNVAIDRGAGIGALKKILVSAQRIIGEGRSIVIFPEGTRTIPGKPGRYHSGVAALYANLNLPVVPVALNSGLYWGKRAFIKKPGVITLELLSPIMPGLKPKEFLRTLETAIEQASIRLLADAAHSPASPH